jgi:hypothetical protein
MPTTINEFKPANVVTEASNPASWSSTPGFQKQFNTENFKVENVVISNQPTNWVLNSKDFKP